MKRILCLFLTLLILSSTLLSACQSESLSDSYLDNDEALKATEGSEKGTAEGEPSQTAPEVTAKPEQKDPSADHYLNVLVIGNSFSTGWPDELNGLLSAAGVKANVFTVYYSGCPLSSHWHWLKTGQKHYRLRHHKQGGGVDDDEPVNLEYCLKQKNWDVISLQQHFGPSNALSYDNMMKSCTPFAKNLFDYLKENFPKSKLVWHETWAYEIGWSRDGVTVPDKEFQDQYQANIRAASHTIATENGVPIVPCGDAWAIARAIPNIGDMTRDKYHDGPEGGGQYLNACVWFECLTGQSCIGNTWRPKYALAEEKIPKLQEAAHRAVEENPIQ